MKRRNRDNDSRLFTVALAIIAGLIVAICVWGCSPRIIEHTSIQHDTTRVVVRDSVTFYDRDSIFIRERGDTVYQYVEKWRYRDRVHTDTVYRVRVDSVAVERVKEVQVARPLSRWQSFKIGGFWYLCGALLLCIAWIFRKQILKFF